MKLHPFLIVAVALSAGTLRAADQNPAEAKLRETLRNTMLQLRTSESERATLQAAQAENDQKVKTLTEQSAALSKQLAADKLAADKTLLDLKARGADLEAENARLKEALEKWKAGYQEAANLAKTKEAERAKFSTQAIALQRKVADRETKNRALFKLGNEILTRYEKFGLGDALAAREPFTGITRVKLENLVQDYDDKLREQRIAP